MSKLDHLSDSAKLDAAVDRFAAEMKAKLQTKLAEGWGGWDDPAFTPDDMIERARNHLSRIELGDPFQDVDVANFMMFHFARREHL